jgi:hypothetical protein
MNYSFMGEFSARYRIYKHLFLKGAAYYETIDNDFVASKEGFAISHNKNNLSYKIAEMSLLFDNPKGSCFTLFFKLVNSNGRGADFLKEYKGMGFGIKLSR